MHRCCMFIAALAATLQLEFWFAGGFGWRPPANPALPFPARGSRERGRNHASSDPATDHHRPNDKEDGCSSHTGASRRKTRRVIHRRARRIARVRRGRQRQQTVDSTVRDGLQPRLDSSRAAAVRKKSRVSPTFRPEDPSLRPRTDGTEHSVTDRCSPSTGMPSAVRVVPQGLWRWIFSPRSLVEVHSVEQLSELLDGEDRGLETLSVRADYGSGTPVDDARADRDPHGKHDDCSEWEQYRLRHPVVQAVLDRAASGTVPSMHGDGRRIGLAIEVRGPGSREGTPRAQFQSRSRVSVTDPEGSAPCPACFMIRARSRSSPASARHRTRRQAAKPSMPSVAGADRSPAARHPRGVDSCSRPPPRSHATGLTAGFELLGAPEYSEPIA